MSDLSAGAKESQAPDPVEAFLTKEDLLGPDGKPLPAERANLVRRTFALMKELTEDERGVVLCWFCSACRRYVGPRDTCYCHPAYDE